MSEGYPLFVAEVGANHRGSLDIAKQHIRAAAAAGADAVKFQVWHPDLMAGHSKELVAGPWEGRSLEALYRQAWLPWTLVAELQNTARELGLIWFASVFDHIALRFLEEQQCPMYKIASFELVDLSLIADVAATGKPLIMSTGMASREEIVEAVRIARECGAWDITLLKCTSAYPAPHEDMNLRAMAELSRFHCKYGLSDHSRGPVAAVVAAALGASLIEKHFVCEEWRSGSLDEAFSATPEEFAQMVRFAKEACAVLGSGGFGCAPSELPQKGLRRSLHYSADLPSGHVIEEQDLFCARPADGLPDWQTATLLGLTLKRSVMRGAPVRAEDV